MSQLSMLVAGIALHAIAGVNFGGLAINIILGLRRCAAARAIDKK